MRGGGGRHFCLPRVYIYLVFVCGGYVVVLCAQVGRCCDEVHVEVGVVILLELDRHELQLQRLGSWQLRLNLLQLIHVYKHRANCQVMFMLNISVNVFD